MAAGVTFPPRHALRFFSKLLPPNYQIAVCLAVLMTSGMRGVRGEGEAVVFLHQTSESVVEIRGQFARIGGLDSEGIVGVDLRMVTRV